MSSAVKTKVQHTPGPWRAEVKPDVMTARVFGPKHADGGDYAELFTTTNKANAHLIAAAPDGYALALRLLDYFPKGKMDSLLDCDIEIRQMARDLIAKAEGRQ